MNELLQKHGCSNVFTIPEGLKELISDITREVLREQPKNIYDFITNYLSVLLLTREHGLMAVRILEELCDCRPSVSEHLLNLGLDKDTATILSNVIKDEIDSFEANKYKDKIKEIDILKKILTHVILGEEMAAQVCQVARNAYKEYSYKKSLMEQSMKMRAEEPWEVAAERTLAMYKQTKPTLNELHRATERIQAAYKGYYVRRNLLKHLKPKKYKKTGPKEALPGPPLDIASSREIDLGPVIDINVPEDDVNGMFGEHATVKLGLHYDPMLTLTHMEDQNSILDHPDDPFLEVSEKNENAANYLTIPINHSATSQVHTVHVDSRKRDSKNTFHASIMRHGLSHESHDHNSGDEEHVLDYRSVGTPARKISFSMVPPELIPNDDFPDEDQEVQEAIQEAFDELGVENGQEIPEDIPDGVADDYTPVGSVASLVSTDVEEHVYVGHEDD